MTDVVSSPLLLGSHLSVAGGLHKAAHAARTLGLGCVQIFTKNQKTWSAPPLADDVVDAWRDASQGLGPNVSHASYLINPATPDPTLRQKSLTLLVDELCRCARLGVPYVVIHPGAHMGDGESAGVARAVSVVSDALEIAACDGVTLCLESTAGQGTCVGHDLAHLRDIRDACRHPHAVAFCLDTAHLCAAGYELRGDAYADFARRVDATLGASFVKVWHVNDSKRELGSRVDRHEHVGSGHVGDAGFRPLVNDPRWRNVPMILETPKGKDADGRDWDVVNAERLRSLTHARGG